MIMHSALPDPDVWVLQPEPSGVYGIIGNCVKWIRSLSAFAPAVLYFRLKMPTRCLPRVLLRAQADD